MVKKQESNMNQWVVIIVVLAGLFFASMVFATILSISSDTGNVKGSGNVLVIPIKGVISTSQTDSLFSGAQASSDNIVSLINDAEEDSGIFAVMFEIDSPGGSPVGSHEIVKAIKDMTKPNVALIRGTGASGAYWAASATDYIISDELSLTGSVGVFSSYIDFSGFMNDNNITYQRIVGGDYKDIGSPFKELTDSERDELQRKITLMHEYFLNDVSISRELTRNQEAQIKTGVYFIGLESLDLGLIDSLGGEKEAKEYLEEKLNETVKFSRITKKNSFLDVFGSFMSNHGYQMGRGLSSELTTKDVSIELR